MYGSENRQINKLKHPRKTGWCWTRFFLHSYACPWEINHVTNFQNIRSRSVDIFFGNQLIPRRNKCTCGHFNRWVKNVFRTNSKMLAGELSRGSVSRAYFYRSEAPQQAEARSTKIVFVRRNFRSSWASQPIASVSVNDLWKGRMRQLDHLDTLLV